MLQPNSIMKNSNICCLYDKKSTKATNAFYSIKKYFNIEELRVEKIKEYSTVITLGGDGQILRALHLTKNSKAEIFGMNLGSVGFLLNEYSIKNLLSRIRDSKYVRLNPLKMQLLTWDNQLLNLHAFNEISLLREINQIAKIRIYIDNVMRMESLYADGVIVATPAGSTAYNFAASGPIIPLDANLLTITPISPFRPRRWPGALIHDKSKIRLKILDYRKRPVSALADSKKIRNIQSVEVNLDRTVQKKILFDKQSGLEERVFQEQFYKNTLY